MNLWLVVYNAAMLVHAVIHLSYTIIWIKAKDPTMQLTRIRIFFHMWIYLLEAVWFIYGNTFIYSDDIKACEDNFQKRDGE